MRRLDPDGQQFLDPLPPGVRRAATLRAATTLAQSGPHALSRAVPDAPNPLAVSDILALIVRNCARPESQSSFNRTAIALGDRVWA
jgi:hypothetical protein